MLLLSWLSLLKTYTCEGKSLPPFGTEPISIFLPANAAKDLKSMLEQNFSRSPANARRNTCDDRR